MHVFLETERLILRRFTTDDADLLVELEADPEVMRYVPDFPATRDEILDETLPAFLSYYERFESYGFWAAIVKDTGTFIGWFHFRPEPDAPVREPELGFRLTRSAWNQGYATEGSRALIDHGFTSAGIERVTASAMVDNLGSRRVLEKSGLHHLRTTKLDWPAKVTTDKPEAAEYALTRKEWESVREN